MSEVDTGAMQLSQAHVAALDSAETLTSCSNFNPYLELKDLFPDASVPARQRFRKLFCSFYGLNRGGLTNEFKDRFFAILFSGSVMVDGKPDYASILYELSGIKRSKGDYAMPFSFVSKLVAMHCESSPIVDRHVFKFFGEEPPDAAVDKASRIDWFVRFLDLIRRSYRAWAIEPGVVPALSRLKSRDARLSGCDDVRLIDFLVWTVGNKRLLTK